MPGPFFPGYVTKGDFSAISATATHELGTWGYGAAGKILQYVKFGSTANIKAYNWVGLDVAAATDTAYTVNMLLAAATHAVMGVAEYGGTAGSYGWITRYGPATANTGAITSAKGAPLINDAAASGTLSFNAAYTATLGSLARGSGILIGSPSVSGTYVHVRAL